MGTVHYAAGPIGRMSHGPHVVVTADRPHKWRRHVADVVKLLVAALQPDDVALGGGNVKRLKELPLGCRTGDNMNAFKGGFRLWEGSTKNVPRAGSKQGKKKARSR